MNSEQINALAREQITFGDEKIDAFRKGYLAALSASAEQQPVELQDIEQYRLQMAAISTAAIGYWKEGDGIHPDYDTVALRDVAKLYAKYDELFKAQASQPAALTDEQREKVCEAVAEALGEAYDCTRVWSAWSYNTMGPDDFALVAEDDSRVAEIADAAIKAVLSAASQPSAWNAAIEADLRKEVTDKAWAEYSMATQKDATLASISVHQLRTAIRLTLDDAIRALRQQAPADTLTWTKGFAPLPDFGEQLYVEKGQAPAVQEGKSYCGAKIELRYGSTSCGKEFHGTVMQCDKCESAASHPAPAQTGEKTK